MSIGFNLLTKTPGDAISVLVDSAAALIAKRTTETNEKVEQNQVESHDQTGSAELAEGCEEVASGAPASGDANRELLLNVTHPAHSVLALQSTADLETFNQSIVNQDVAKVHSDEESAKALDVSDAPAASNSVLASSTGDKESVFVTSSSGSQEKKSEGKMIREAGRHKRWKVKHAHQSHGRDAHVKHVHHHKCRKHK